MKTAEEDRLAREAHERGAEWMVFDWERAACRIAETRPHYAFASVGYNCEISLADGRLVDQDFAGLASLLHEPELDLETEPGVHITEPCWRPADEPPAVSAWARELGAIRTLEAAGYPTPLPVLEVDAEWLRKHSICSGG